MNLSTINISAILPAAILSVFGINPKALDGARKENTKVLPGFD